jgi:hypothetical protein
MVRLGGIYALERIARDSESDHWAVMEVLTAFVREQPPAQTMSPDKSSGERETVNVTCAINRFMAHTRLCNTSS